MDPLNKFLYCLLLNNDADHIEKVRYYIKCANIHDQRALSLAKEKFFVSNENAPKLLLEYIVNKEDFIRKAYIKLDKISEIYNLEKVERGKI